MSSWALTGRTSTCWRSWIRQRPVRARQRGSIPTATKPRWRNASGRSRPSGNGSAMLRAQPAVRTRFAPDHRLCITKSMVGPLVQLVGPEHGLQVGGVKLLGFNAINARKLLFTVILLVGLYLLSKTLRGIAKAIGGARQRTAFWTRQR